MKTNTNTKAFFILLALTSISVACVFPYVITLQGETLRQIGQPLWVIFLVQFVQSLVLFSLTIWLGLKFTRKIGFQLPLITAILEKRDYKTILKSILARSVLIGTAAAIAIYLLDAVLALQGVGISTHLDYAPVWQRLLAAVYGGVTEEVIMRLFLMSFFIWIGLKLSRREQPGKASIIISMVIAAIIFGLGHLPITAAITQITPLIVGRAVLLNGVAGIAFGWLFWKKGLESAIIAHFTADIVLLTLLPLLF